MIRIMIKYRMEIPEDRLDKYCDRVGLTRATGKRFLKDMAETQGRVEVYNHVDYIINEGR